MAKARNSEGKSSRSRGDATVVIGAVNDSPEGLKFGAVRITATQVDQAIVRRNVEQGQQALARAAKKLYQPGVSIRAAKGVPLYSVDEGRPDRLVRKLDGKIEHGVLEGGRFKVVHE